MIASPVVSVIVPARDAAATLAATLAGLERQTLKAPFEVVVVDNGSTDDTVAVAESSALAPRVLRRERGEGPGAARNDGVAAARGTVIAFLDSDCTPTPGWLAAGLAAIEAGADLVQGRVDAEPGVGIGPYDRTLWVQSEYGLYETANLFVRREWFERVGGFTDFVGGRGRPFGEDSWWAWRARRAGARSTFAADAIVHHAVFGGEPRAHLREVAQRRFFPALVARVPELREVFLWRRMFLNARSAAFDGAVAGVIAAALTRRAWPLAAVAPWARMAWRDAGRGGSRPRTLAWDAAADAVTLRALAQGSAETRTPVL